MAPISETAVSAKFKNSCLTYTNQAAIFLRALLFSRHSAERSRIPKGSAAVLSWLEYVPGKRDCPSSRQAGNPDVAKVSWIFLFTSVAFIGISEFRNEAATDLFQQFRTQLDLLILKHLKYLLLRLAGLDLFLRLITQGFVKLFWVHVAFFLCFRHGHGRWLGQPPPGAGLSTGLYTAPVLCTILPSK